MTGHGSQGDTPAVHRYSGNGQLQAGRAPGADNGGAGGRGGALLVQAWPVAAARNVRALAALFEPRLRPCFWSTTAAWLDVSHAAGHRQTFRS